jgi:hypothetical protein
VCETNSPQLVGHFRQGNLNRISDGLRYEGKWIANKPYVLDPSVQTGPQYGSAGAMYPAGFSTAPAPNSLAVSSYPSQPVNTTYPSSDIYNPADSINAQPGGVSPGILLDNAPLALNGPPVVKNSSRTQAVYAIPDVQMYAEHAGTRKWKSLMCNKRKADRSGYLCR